MNIWIRLITGLIAFWCASSAARSVYDAYLAGQIEGSPWTPAFAALAWLLVLKIRE